MVGLKMRTRRKRTLSSRFIIILINTNDQQLVPWVKLILDRMVRKALLIIFSDFSDHLYPQVGSTQRWCQGSTWRRRASQSSGSRGGRPRARRWSNRWRSGWCWGWLWMIGECWGWKGVTEGSEGLGELQRSLKKLFGDFKGFLGGVSGCMRGGGMQAAILVMKMKRCLWNMLILLIMDFFSSDWAGTDSWTEPGLGSGELRKCKHNSQQQLQT